MTANVFPDFGAVGGIAIIREVVGALMTVTLVVAVLMLIICTASWALGAASGNVHLVARARIGVLVSCGAAALTGGGLGLVGFLLDVGRAL